MGKRGRLPKESVQAIKKEQLEAVDDSCNPIGVLTRAEIHQKGLPHRSVHIFLFNDEGQIYIHRRSLDREENPGLWNSSASGHILVGETPLLTAKRELKEELGLNVKLTQVLSVKPCPETNFECVVLFEGRTKKMPKPNPREILEGKFISIPELEEWMEKNPEDFSPAFRYLWKLYRETKAQTQE
ncbi:MAG: NUDIX hydrolase [Thermodesulfobacteriaceae bacterium]|jgi:isopentenyl-diphosphate delta-isomerase